MLKIREIRKAKGLTMKQLGDMVGALESSISKSHPAFTGWRDSGKFRHDCIVELRLDN